MDIAELPNSGKISAKIGCPSDTIDPSIMNELINNLQKSGSSNLGYIPTRDFGSDTTALTSDEKTKVNYIPSSNDQRRNYVDEYIERHDQRDRRPEKSSNFPNSSLFDNSTFLLILASVIIYFIFDLPIFQNLFKKVFSFLPSNESHYHYTLLLSFIKCFLFGTSLFFVFKSLTS